MKKCCTRLRAGVGVDENLPTPTPVKTTDSGRLRLRSPDWKLYINGKRMTWCICKKNASGHILTSWLRDPFLTPCPDCLSGAVCPGCLPGAVCPGCLSGAVCPGSLSGAVCPGCLSGAVCPGLSVWCSVPRLSLWCSVPGMSVWLVLSLSVCRWSVSGFNPSSAAQPGTQTQIDAGNQSDEGRSSLFLVGASGRPTDRRPTGRAACGQAAAPAGHPSPWIR